MNRIVRGNVALKRRKKYLKLAKGYTGLNSRSSILATEQIIQSLNSSYINRKLKKRFFRRIWILRINSVVRLKKINYSLFIGFLKKNKIYLNKKILYHLAFQDNNLFYHIINFFI
jgi:large subunit ribosomal protein L20